MQTGKLSLCWGQAADASAAVTAEWPLYYSSAKETSRPRPPPRSPVGPLRPPCSACDHFCPPFL